MTAMHPLWLHGVVDALEFVRECGHPREDVDVLVDSGSGYTLAVDVRVRESSSAPVDATEVTTETEVEMTGMDGSSSDHHRRLRGRRCDGHGDAAHGVDAGAGGTLTSRRPPTI